VVMGDHQIEATSGLDWRHSMAPLTVIATVMAMCALAIIAFLVRRAQMRVINPAIQNEQLHQMGAVGHPASRYFGTREDVGHPDEDVLWGRRDLVVGGAIGELRQTSRSPFRPRGPAVRQLRQDLDIVTDLQVVLEQLLDVAEANRSMSRRVRPHFDRLLRIAFTTVRGTAQRMRRPSGRGVSDFG
jgi:hypothetical protein